MLIVIDIGNTNITMGLVDKDEIIDNYRLTTKLERTSDEYGFMLLSFLQAFVCFLPPSFLASRREKVLHLFRQMSLRH